MNELLGRKVFIIFFACHRLIRTLSCHSDHCQIPSCLLWGFSMPFILK